MRSSWQITPLQFLRHNRKQFSLSPSTNEREYMSRITATDMLYTTNHTDIDKELTDERMYDLKEFGFDPNTPWYDAFTSDYEECLYNKIDGILIKLLQSCLIIKHLYISSFQSLTDKELHSIIDNFKYLKELTIEYCNSITNEGIKYVKDNSNIKLTVTDCMCLERKSRHNG